MKVFVKDYDFKKLPFVYVQTSMIQKIMTSDGVFEFHKDGFYEIQYKEIKREVRKIKHLEFLIEDMQVRRLNKTYHIPYDHLFIEEIREEASVAPGITLVKESYAGKEDYYFETQEENARLFIQLFGILV